MFDEKSEKWIRIFKRYTQVLFWLLIAAAVICCFMGWGERIEIVFLPFLDGIILLVLGVFAACAQLVVNMMFINHLNNIQMIRERIEKITYKDIYQSACGQDNSTQYYSTSNVEQNALNELEEYKRLLHDGIITEDEFQAKKEQLLKMI